jgi:hypothetical protein
MPEALRQFPPYLPHSAHRHSKIRQHSVNLRSNNLYFCFALHRKVAKFRMRPLATMTPSASSRARLANKSRPYPPNLPPAEMTRWQGTDESLVARMMLPTARWARGRPAAAATSPYVATRPWGMRRTTERTRAAKLDARTIGRLVDSTIGRLRDAHPSSGHPNREYPKICANCPGTRLVVDESTIISLTTF